MNTGSQANFDQRAGTWDADAARVRLATDVASAIGREVSPSPDLDVLDVGCGTGLVTLQLQPHVRTITGVDGSKGMLEVLLAKVTSRGLKNVSTQLVDLERGGAIQGRFHLIVSSMTLHHVADPELLIRQLTELLHPGGALAIADLDSEDGSFHHDNTGVRHFGFERTLVRHLFEKAGLHHVHDVTAAVAARQRETMREYSVFLVTGRK